MVQAMQESCDEGVTDEFIKPINNSTVDGTIKEGDVVIFFNYRNDHCQGIDCCADSTGYAGTRYAYLFRACSFIA